MACGYPFLNNINDNGQNLYFRDRGDSGLLHVNIPARTLFSRQPLQHALLRLKPVYIELEPVFTLMGITNI